MDAYTRRRNGETSDEITTTLASSDARDARLLTACLARRNNGVANMDPANRSVPGSIMRRAQLVFETKLANTRKFDLSTCTSDTTIDNHAASLALVAGNVTSITPLLRGTTFDDFDLQQASEDGRTGLMSHWSPANPGDFQVTDGERFLLPSVELSNATIEDVPLRHIRGQARHFAVYAGPTFFGSGLFFAVMNGSSSSSPSKMIGGISDTCVHVPDKTTTLTYVGAFCRLFVTAGKCSVY